MSSVLSKVALMLTVSAMANLSGCQTFFSYDAAMVRTLDLAAVGEIGAAVDAHQRQHARQHDLLYYLELGELLRLAGRYEDSQHAWFEADRIVQGWEEQARLHPERLLGDVGSLLVNDSTRSYTGQDFEKVMLTTRMALNHLALGEWNLARIAIKRTHEREAVIASLRAEQVQRAEAQAQERTGELRDFRDLNGYPVQTIDSPEVNALRNSYQSAFSHYLAGFVYEALGETGLAAAGYRQAVELQPGVALLEHGLADLDDRVHGRTRSGDTDLLVVVETGVAPGRTSVNINLPVITEQGLLPAPVSFPVLRQRGRAIPDVRIIHDTEQESSANAVSSVDLMARRALRDEMPWIMLRAIARATTKVSLQRAALKNDDSGLAGAIAIVGAIVTERADERSWRSLPAEIAVARLHIPHGSHDVEFDVANRRQRYAIHLDSPYAVMTVRQIGESTYMSISSAQRDAVALESRSHPIGIDWPMHSVVVRLFPERVNRVVSAHDGVARASATR